MEKFKTIHENKVMINPPIKLSIKTQNWSHTCGDGCCDTWGTDVFINGNKVTQGDYSDTTEIIKEVLEHLGYEIEIDDETE